MNFIYNRLPCISPIVCICGIKCESSLLRGQKWTNRACGTLTHAPPSRRRCVFTVEKRTHTYLKQACNVSAQRRYKTTDRVSLISENIKPDHAHRWVVRYRWALFSWLKISHDLRLLTYLTANFLQLPPAKPTAFPLLCCHPFKPHETEWRWCPYCWCAMLCKYNRGQRD